jgi:hypothetical protein
MQRITRLITALRRFIYRPSTVYVVARTRDDKITDVEVYSDMWVATRRQRALGNEFTCMASRGIDDPIWEQRHLAAVRNIDTYRRRYA